MMGICSLAEAQRAQSINIVNRRDVEDITGDRRSDFSRELLKFATKVAPTNNQKPRRSLPNGLRVLFAPGGR